MTAIIALGFPAYAVILVLLWPLIGIVLLVLGYVRWRRSGGGAGRGLLIAGAIVLGVFLFGYFTGLLGIGWP